jgi:hypothetical protein
MRRCTAQSNGSENCCDPNPLWTSPSVCPDVIFGKDTADRRRLHPQRQILVKDIPMFSLFYSVEYGALRNNVHGFAWIPDQIPRFRDL